MPSPGPEKLDVQLNQLVHNSRRLLSAAVIVLAGLVLVLIAAVTWLTIKIDSNTTRIQEQVTAQCAAGNAYRAGDEQNWKFFISLPVTPARPAARIAALNRFLSYVAQIDKQQSC